MRLDTTQDSVCLFSRDTRASSYSSSKQSVHSKICALDFLFWLEQRGIDALYSTDVGFDVAIITREKSLDPCHKNHCQTIRCTTYLTHVGMKD